MEPRPGDKWLHNAWLITDRGKHHPPLVEEVNVWGYDPQPGKGQQYGEFWVKFPYQSETEWFRVHGSRLKARMPDQWETQLIKRET